MLRIVNIIFRLLPSVQRNRILTGSESSYGGPVRWISTDDEFDFFNFLVGYACSDFFEQFLLSK